MKTVQRLWICITAAVTTDPVCDSPNHSNAS